MSVGRPGRWALYASPPDLAAGGGGGCGGCEVCSADVDDCGDGGDDDGWCAVYQGEYAGDFVSLLPSSGLTVILHT